MPTQKRLCTPSSCTAKLLTSRQVRDFQRFFVHAALTRVGGGRSIQKNV
jgi:hypothetical protein